MAKKALNITDLKRVRLDRYEDEKKRAVKIQFSHEQQMQEIIRNARSLKNLKARNELLVRLESGVTNLKIQFQNNILVIISKTPYYPNIKDTFKCYFKILQNFDRNVCLFFCHQSWEFYLDSICETNFSPDINRSEYFPDNYVIFRKDRRWEKVKEKSGGVY